MKRIMGRRRKKEEKLRTKTTTIIIIRLRIRMMLNTRSMVTRRTFCRPPIPG
jgi:hypothetical protein